MDMAASWACTTPMITTDTSKRSSTFAKVSYDAAAGALEVHFKTGGGYRYYHVSPTQHAAFMAQPSLGKAYNSMFWGKPKEHPSQKIEPTPPPTRSLTSPASPPTRSTSGPAKP
jgi:KTSC domain